MTGKAWFGILGPLAAGVDGGQRLELAGRKQRELLALLLTNSEKARAANRHVVVASAETSKPAHARSLGHLGPNIAVVMPR